MAETEPQGAAGAPVTPQVRILTHFVRDLSFENVAAIEGHRLEGQPNISVTVNLDGKHLEADHYQVLMKLSCKAVAGTTTRFLTELEYCGVFSIQNAPESHIHPIMFIECPRQILPFARRVIADVTRDGGYPPVMLDNVDFAVLYRQKLEQLRQQQPAPESKPN
jgi:preprotein translocase subunit SecB